jgi:hypothetical protein
MIKKGLLVVAGLACLISSPLHAYRYRVANLTSANIYIDLRAATKGTMFEGARGASDSWAIKDYDMIPAKSSKDYSFKGIFCIDAIRVGNSPSDLSPMPIQKAPDDVTAFNNTVTSIAVLDNTIYNSVKDKQIFGKSVDDLVNYIPEDLRKIATVILDQLKGLVNPIGTLASGWLCFDMTFFIGINPYKTSTTYGGVYDYVIIAKQDLVDTSRFTNITASFNEPKSLPDTPFWKQAYDNLMKLAPLAKEGASVGVKAAGGAGKLKDEAVRALPGQK